VSFLAEPCRVEVANQLADEGDVLFQVHEKHEK
jgi:hypothetical protein